MVRSFLTHESQFLIKVLVADLNSLAVAAVEIQAAADIVGTV